jgi:hypothetical protein
MMLALRVLDARRPGAEADAVVCDAGLSYGPSAAAAAAAAAAARVDLIYLCYERRDGRLDGLFNV